jgi:lipopolysaccharide/colanic/teichoic acid biosynthesis glycosyltransferase
MEHKLFYFWAKRKIDLLVSIVGLFFSSPIMLVICLLIKWTSKGPIFYKQKRVGLRRKEFLLYKFRTMIKDAEEYTGPIWAAENDNRVTKIGKVLRRSRLDELPQLVNVLIGDMGLVGPRPERPFFVNQHKVLQGIRLSVKPGLTGLAQVEVYYHTRPRNKLRYDRLYIENQSISLDIKILLKTLLVILTKPGS